MDLLALIAKALDGAGLSAPQLSALIAEAAAKLPPGSTQDQVNAFLNNHLATAFDPANIASVRAQVASDAAVFFTTGKGPTKKSPTDLVG